MERRKRLQCESIQQLHDAALNDQHKAKFVLDQKHRDFQQSGSWFSKLTFVELLLDLVIGFA
jgi:hypothetical protein